jgi:hypothetical protein
LSTLAVLVETRGVEYNQSAPFAELEPHIVKTSMATANLRGGGYIIIDICGTLDPGKDKTADHARDVPAPRVYPRPRERQSMSRSDVHYLICRFTFTILDFRLSTLENDHITVRVSHANVRVRRLLSAKKGRNDWI